MEFAYRKYLQKLMKYTSIFYKLRGKLPVQMLREIYYAFIHSHVLYGVEIYANTKPTYLDKLTKLNNKLLRILQCKPITTPIRGLYKICNLKATSCITYMLVSRIHKVCLLMCFRWRWRFSGCAG